MTAIYVRRLVLVVITVALVVWPWPATAQERLTIPSDFEGDLASNPGAVTSAGPLLRQWASDASATSQYGEGDWSPTQATGAPDSEGCGDKGTAWASATSTGMDALTLKFAQAVVPTQINVHQNYTPGSITGVDVVLADGSGTKPIPKSADRDKTCPHVFQLKLPAGLPPVNGVVIHVDQRIGGNWNEIDAVELIGEAQPTATNLLNQWASGAQATSQYGNDTWSASQATGAPDSQGCGDKGTAWAAADSTGVDALTVTYDEAVVPTQINIHQNYKPGSITKVELVLVDGSGTKTIPNSADPDKTCPHVFQLKVPAGLPPVNGVVVHVDQKLGGGWNEIDAVELIGEAKPAGPAPLKQWAADAKASSQYGDDDWSAAQATGAANSQGCGDKKSAWASATSAGADSLTLTFAQAVVPTQINIHQNYTPGSITKVELLLADGSGTKSIPNSADPDKTCPHVFKLKVPPGLPPVNGVVIYVDQSIGGGWNEIDAVELVGTSKQTGAAHLTQKALGLFSQWASSASATSQYGNKDWSAAQAAGAPNSPQTCGDKRTAWASAMSSGVDALTLKYAQAVVPAQINIHQFYKPGSITGVDLVRADGTGTVAVPDSADPDTTCPHVFQLRLPAGLPPVNSIVIHLDQKIGGGWNEIDAVELIGSTP